MSDKDYQAALALVQKKVARQKSLNPQSLNARSEVGVRNPVSHAYQVGDRWEVAAWSFQNTMARMTTDPAHLQSKGGHGGIFLYEVKTPRLIQVTQLEEFGIKKLDPRVLSLKLTLDEQGVVSRKVYEMQDEAGKVHEIPVSPDGIHSSITRLELFALEVPELATAEQSSPTAIPTLPDGLQTIATQSGYHFDPTHSVSYDQDDFFGRGMQAIWQQGDPWPAYFKTSNGVSILIHKGAS
jgi:hypothetical protein